MNFVLAGSGMTNMLSKLSILGEFNDLLNLLENLMSRKNFASVICSTESFLPENRDSMCGRDIEEKTLLGAAFGISAIPDIIENPMMPSRGRAPDVADRCFPGADSDRPADIQSSSSMIQVSLNQLQSGLHRIIMTLLKNNETKSKILDWIALALNANRERTKMRPDMKKASTDGFMINMCSVLLRLCRPFLDASNGKAWSKLDVKYASDPRARGHCFEDDTRLGLATDALATWVTDEISSKEQPSYHFICECFFLTANALRLGIFKGLDNCQQLVRAAREYDREAAHMAVDTFSSMRTSSLKRVSSRLKSMAMCLEASLQQEDFLIDFISFYALIASYLPKLAFSNTEVKDGVHSLQLPSPAPKAFLSLPVGSFLT
jgi:ubiquitin conjugation factor E4 B